MRRLRAGAKISTSARQGSGEGPRNPRNPALTPPANVVREFFLGFIKIHILHHAGDEPVYGLALIAELRRHGYELSPGTLYPVLHQLEQTGYLRRLNRVVSGKVRKYYALTRRGSQALSDARAKIGELVGEVLDTGTARIDAKARHTSVRSARIRTTS